MERKTRMQGKEDLLARFLRVTRLQSVGLIEPGSKLTGYKVRRTGVRISEARTSSNSISARFRSDSRAAIAEAQALSERERGLY